LNSTDELICQRAQCADDDAGSGRWSHWDEIGWVHYPEIGWSHSGEIRGSNHSKSCTQSIRHQRRLLIAWNSVRPASLGARATFHRGTPGPGSRLKRHNLSGRAAATCLGRRHIRRGFEAGERNEG
jgi:hypothetical protein